MTVNDGVSLKLEELDRGSCQKRGQITGFLSHFWGTPKIFNHSQYIVSESNIQPNKLLQYLFSGNQPCLVTNAMEGFQKLADFHIFTKGTHTRSNHSLYIVSVAYIQLNCGAQKCKNQPAGTAKNARIADNMGPLNWKNQTVEAAKKGVKLPVFCPIFGVPPKFLITVSISFQSPTYS